MSAAGATRNKEVASFRARLFTAIMVIVATLTALGFYLAQHRVTAAGAGSTLSARKILSLSRRHRHSHQATQSLGCRRIGPSDRSSTFADKIAPHTADRVYPIFWHYSRSFSRANLLNRYRGSG